MGRQLAWPSRRGELLYGRLSQQQPTGCWHIFETRRAPRHQTLREVHGRKPSPEVHPRLVDRTRHFFAKGGPMESSSSVRAGQTPAICCESDAPSFEELFARLNRPAYVTASSNARFSGAPGKRCQFAELRGQPWPLGRRQAKKKIAVREARSPRNLLAADGRRSCFLESRGAMNNETSPCNFAAPWARLLFPEAKEFGPVESLRMRRADFCSQNGLSGGSRSTAQSRRTYPF